MPMIIAIDGYEANQSKRVGIGRYAYELLRSMYEVLEKEHDDLLNVRIYLPSKPLSDMPKACSWWHYRVVGPSKLWTFIGLPLALSRDLPRAKVIFSPTHYAPRFTRIPSVISIMDMSFLHYPKLFRKKDLHKLVHWTRYSAKRAARILSISEFTKRAILKSYNQANSKVVVTYPGFTMVDKSGTPTFDEIVKKYHIREHYILSVGTLQPRKNFGKLIEAFSVFLQQNKQKFGTIELLIVGKKGWLYDDILATPARVGVRDQVKFLNFVSDVELSVLYEHALCFALPSLYEGFGLPVLEAMAHSCPVVISDVSSMPEIAGNAGVYVDPENTANIAKGLLTAVRERNLMQGRNRIKHGLDQVKKFTWEKAARQTLAVLEEVGRSA
jgi:glycosyltransferase involved in cell wall biosynthesis